MGDWTPIPFAGTTAQPRSKAASLELLQNLYPEINPEGAKGPVTLYGTPGMVLFGTAGTGPIRGMCAMRDELYVVSGDRLYVVANDGAARDLGEIKGTGECAIETNGTHVTIASGSWLYAANKSGISNPWLRNVNGITSQDGYTIFTEAWSNRFWLSALGDATTIDALDFATAEALPGTLMGCVSDKRELVLFSEDHAEVWQNTGASGFPFERGQGGVLNRGCGSSASICMVAGSVFWIGDDWVVYTLAGYLPQRVSLPWIEKAIAEDSDPTAARSWSYQEPGHTFLVIGLTEKTLCLDTSTNRWHTRKSQGRDTWIGRHHARCYGRELVGGPVDGKIYYLDSDVYADNGVEIERVAISPPISAGAGRAAMHALAVDVEPGVGLVSGQGSDPILSLDWTDDGGNTWSARRYASAGRMGEYQHRVQWTRLGAFRERSFRITISDPVRVAITGAYAQLEARS